MAQREENGRGNFSVDNFSGGWLTINTRKGEGKIAKGTRENSKRVNWSWDCIVTCSGM